jgi:hypothetical protein
MWTRPAVCLALTALLLPAYPCRPQIKPRNTGAQASPLAFIRRLAVPPSILKTAAEEKAPAHPSPKDKRSTAAWEGRMKARALTAALRLTAPAALDASFLKWLSRVPGLEALTASSVSSASDAAESRSTGGAFSADGTLLLVIDRFATESGLERGIWLRCAASLQPSGDRSCSGPYYGVGAARAGRKLIGKGFTRTDEQLVAQACDQAVAQILHGLLTGEQALFGRGERVAIVPAVVPGRIEKRFGFGGFDEGSGISPVAAGSRKERETQPVALPSLIRQADILFQPEIGPMPEIIDAAAAVEQLRAVQKNDESLFGLDGELNTALAARLAVRLNADLLFFSSVREMDLQERAAEVSDGKLPRSGIERRVDVLVCGVLYSASEKKVLWKSSAEGGTIAITEYVRHDPRIRTDEQCVLDAVRTAYGHLRFNFDEYRRHFERYP